MSMIFNISKTSKIVVHQDLYEKDADILDAFILANNAVIKILGEEKSTFWWLEPNPYLGNLTPAELLVMGKARIVFDFISETTETINS